MLPEFKLTTENIQLYNYVLRKPDTVSFLSHCFSITSVSRVDFIYICLFFKHFINILFFSALQ